MLGTFDAAHWARPRQRGEQEFVANSRRNTSRLPTVYASQGYDAALLIDSAVREVKGKIEIPRRSEKRSRRRNSSRCAVRSSSTATSTDPNYYLRVVGKDSQGRLVNKTSARSSKDRGDAYVQDCPMR